jgi:hypothetical protein
LPKHRLNTISVTCCCIELLNDGVESFSTASGFLWRVSTRVFLITNWHVVTGVHAFSGQHLDNGRCPSSLRVHYNHVVELPNDQLQILPHSITVPLFHDFHNPLWFEHRFRSAHYIDVIALDISSSLGEHIAAVRCVNDFVYDDLVEFVGADILVIGYPLGSGGGNLPIYKRGSIATEPQFSWKDRPAFLVDCRTSGGMSGSPVIRMVFGPAALSSGQILMDRIQSGEFLAIYSGRLKDDDNVASIGIAWRASVIGELMSNPAPGRRDVEVPIAF